MNKIICLIYLSLSIFLIAENIEASLQINMIEESQDQFNINFKFTLPNLLTFYVSEKKEAENKCDLFLSFFYYNTSNNSVHMNFKQNSCLADEFGFNQGFHQWTMPKNIKRKDMLRVFINGQYYQDISIAVIESEVN